MAIQIGDIPENSVVRGLNNQLYLVRFWETNGIFKFKKYWFYPLTDDFKRDIFKYNPTGLRCEYAEHLTIVSEPRPEFNDLGCFI